MVIDDREVQIRFACVALDTYKDLIEKSNALLMNCLEGFRDTYRVVLLKSCYTASDFSCICICEGIDKENRDKTFEVVIPMKLLYFYEEGDIVDLSDLTVF